MDGLIKRLEALSSANEFLDFFGIAYEERVVHVNRLHILKRFRQYLNQAKGLAGLDEIEMFRRYRELLTQAYRDFTRSNAATEKVFKVFQDADGRQHVPVASLTDSLKDRRRPAGDLLRQAA
jgi:nitrogenase-stabilizing/protective protein